MEWGDVPGWAAFVVALVAVEISRKAYKQGKRSADAANRSATAAEQTLADQRREAAERRAAEAEAARPKVKLRIEYISGETYALRNVGNAPAVGIVGVEHDPDRVDLWPNPLRLDPQEAHEFMMYDSAGASVPTHLRVRWDGQEEPVTLPVR
ncbi:hypothetical protein [Streptomyces mutabilis]|uniref:hypothetical protein n=1 Tax=Streptomyces mutabilis TaxID=67332 RepID=UPI003695C2CB